MARDIGSPRRISSRMVLRYSLPVGLFFAGLVLAVFARPGSPAKAIAPCVPHTPAPIEGEMVALVESWRIQNGIAGAGPLTLSAPLNAAAQGYAQFMADHPGATGHFADGADWSSRAQQCGFTSNGSQAAGGEALGRGATPGEALDFMVANGTGIRTPGGAALPVKCAGVGKAQGPEGTVWIVMLMKRAGDCPQPVTVSSETATPTSTATQPTGGNSPTATATKTVGAPSATATATATFTSTPTATATAVPTRPGSQLPFKIFSIHVASEN